MTSMKNITENPFYYSIEVVIGASLVWYISSNLLGIFEMPLWGLFSFVGTIERDIRFMRILTKQRLVHSVLGIILTFISISLFGTGFWAIFCAYVVAVFICTSLYYYPANWKLAPATVVTLIFFIHQSSHSLFSESLKYASARILEVIVGCIVAIFETYLFSKIIIWIKKLKK